jgi:hypothetical protein
MRVKMELEHGRPRALRYLDYVDAIGKGETVSRRDMMCRLNAAYSTAQYNLERAVSEGELHKVYGFATDTQPGWLYALPETMPKLEGL